MAKLSVYIPPFASDYTGVCSALFDFDCLVAVNDASCCTGHYVYYDEPRWTQKQRPTFSTQLRNVDAILGNDEKVIQRVLDMANEIKSETVALVGTPVPAITGMDMRGMVCEIESRCGRPSFGFDTTGIKYYDSGIAVAGKALIERFAEPCEVKQGTVNVLGITPLDYGNCENEKDVEKALKDMGYEVNARLFMGASLDDVKRLAAAELNVAVSYSGYECAKILEKKFGTPYVTAAPMGEEFFREAVRQDRTDFASDDKVHSDGEKILIVGDQVMANSLRLALRMKGRSGQITVASFFGWSRHLAEPRDYHMDSEKKYVQVLREGGYDMLIADPMLHEIPGSESMRKISLTHPAVSGRLKWQDTQRYLTDDFDKMLSDMAK